MAKCTYIKRYIKIEDTMQLSRLNPSSLQNALDSIGCEHAGHKIMQKKGKIYIFSVKHIPLQALHILKQELLSTGGDLATPKEAILCQEGFYNAIIIATKSQLLRVIDKCRIQPFGLKKLANMLQSHLQTNTHDPKLMPIINLTPDSFHKDSRFSPKQAISHIQSLIEQGAEFIDIGAASSRPGSELIDSSVEIGRLQEVCHFISTHKLYKQTQFSIDTYNPKTAAFALESGFAIINDVSGLDNQEMFDVIRDFGAKVVLMHSKGTPKNMAQLTDYTDLFYEIDCFFEDKISKLQSYNAQEIILDIGFGFAKNVDQNLSLIKHLSHFRHFGLELLVGASNKSTIGAITQEQDTKDRLSGTLSLHLVALLNGANMLRVHDYRAHVDMLRIYKALCDESE